MYVLNGENIYEDAEVYQVQEKIDNRDEIDVGAGLLKYEDSYLKAWSITNFNSLILKGSNLINQVIKENVALNKNNFIQDVKDQTEKLRNLGLGFINYNNYPGKLRLEKFMQMN